MKRPKTYLLTIEMPMVVGADERVAQNPDSAAAAARDFLRGRLPQLRKPTSGGYCFDVDLIHIEAKEKS